MATSKKKAVKKKPVKKAPKKKIGRPKIVIDWDKVENLCKIQCTGEEIASVLEIDYDTLQRTCKLDHKQSFADYIGIKKLSGKASLRRRQWLTAESGNPTMLIWLGKQMLDQRNEPESAGDNDTELAEALSKLADALPS